ncbi:L-idonate 5-dehydrogenase [Microbacterium terrae]|uniref:L-idonate 5-dehydrogenase (NAD(P)(+)) n=1 Tax=Microbacterium terrae TaxID=69369 RepID=A0A0M2H7L7_9MICO|nr:zinc-binding dehydrogenase [Microbacterium terrae]KJL39934.1 L-idonate 5-dehydrogenase (NAD(P)(+)) [Microbacterium terrae]MBP1076872.1 L-idonate 5-dehydrogenase [Microbacterium terrae]GLJ99467.1 L-idonate 5-dehydrogenase [Microbacterium terrae]
MRAAFIVGPESIRIGEIAVPEPAADQVRVRIDYVGICGSDLHYYFDGANGAFVVREPLIPGHEVSGRIDADPTGTWAPGTPVTVHPATFGEPHPDLPGDPHLWPGGAYLGSASTWPHTQGGLVEHLLVDRAMVRPLPSTLPVRRAVLAEPLAVALHGLSKAGDVRGLRVLVTGAGPIGLLAIAAARAAGAAEITATDVLAEPLARARELGAVHVIDVSTEEVPANAYDVVLECSGVAPSISTALRAARIGGTVVQVGMVPDQARPINIAPFISKELRWYGTFRFNDEIDAAIELLDAEPAIEQVVTHVVSADDLQAAFALARDSRVSGKVVVAVWPTD